jgi:hypothetical protein
MLLSFGLSIGINRFFEGKEIMRAGGKDWNTLLTFLVC